MNRYIAGALAAAAIASSAPVLAAAFTVSPGTEALVPGNNDFKGNLAAVGLGSYRTTGATVTLNFNRTLKFEYMGSESGNVNSFTAGSLPAFAEYDKSVWGPVLIGLQNFAAGNFTGASFNGGSVNIGDGGFGIFTPGGVRSFSSDVLYFGLDDFIANADDNHDDFIVRVTAVPEPATWGMLVLGFGLIGASARRRAPKTVTA